MSNKVYRIGEAAKLLGVKTSVLRFWEEEFSQIRPKRTDKGQRYYSEKDMEVLMRIRGLLYEEGMTISGAQKALKKPHDGTYNATPDAKYNATYNASANATANTSAASSQNNKNTAVSNTHHDDNSHIAEHNKQGESQNLPHESAQNLSHNVNHNTAQNPQVNLTGLTPEFYPHTAQTDSMPTPRVLTAGFPDCEHCEENAYLSSMNATLQENKESTVESTVQAKIQASLATQAQYKNSLLDVQNELQDLLALLSTAPSART